jgi:hypothetical protein
MSGKQETVPFFDALGGRLDLIAGFSDHTFTVTTTEAGLDADLGEQDGDLGQRLLPPRSAPWRR